MGRKGDPRQQQCDRDYSIRARLAVLRWYGNKCVCCGENNIFFLTMDHIDGGGAEWRRRTGNHTLVKWLYQHGYPTGYQILCFNCNNTKHICGECPHVQQKTKRDRLIKIACGTDVK